MTFKQPFCVGGDLADESTEADIASLREYLNSPAFDPFAPFDRVTAAPDDCVEDRSPGVSCARFVRSDVKHVFYVQGDVYGMLYCLNIFAELKDGRLVSVHEMSDGGVDLGVNFWSVEDRAAFLDFLKDQMLPWASQRRDMPDIVRTRDALFARIMEGRTVREI